TFGETYAVIRKSGMQPQMFLEVMNELFNSPVYANYGGIIANEKYEPAAFTLKLGLKDVRLVLAAAEETATPMPFASVLRDSFLSALADNQEDLDWSSVARIPARNAGLT
ncbi:MAG TPA: NAD-binding protein, partial [Bryobacteraceae bacterium]